MRNVIDTMEAPAPAPARKAEPHDHAGGYARLRRRVGHAAGAIADRVEDSVWTTRHAVRQGTRRAQDAVYGAAGEIRRRPFSSIGAAFLAGATVASAMTWLVLRPGRRAR